MKKTRELIEENLKVCDLVLELLDSRIPVSSKNPVIDSIVKDKKRIIILNKSDLSDSKSNQEWKEKYRKQGFQSIEVDANKGTGIKELLKMLEKIEAEKNRDKEVKKPLRMMIVGVPNVGKSSIINRLTGRKAAKTGNKPGVTRGKQWLTLENGMQLLDTPGILWPKFEDPNVGLNLAFCGSIKDEILDITDLGFELIAYLEREYPDLLIERYKLKEFTENPDGEREITIQNMEEIAKRRGFILPGKRIDYERTARTVIDEFRAGTIGKITLEKAND
ncbi:MAG: ribosome biogenesis GTPase YlqF [Clostridia bacterium]|nr:ribosome biogenesis GTPase YlqF [Clostridia bacterium]